MPREAAGVIFSAREYPIVRRTAYTALRHSRLAYWEHLKDYGVFIIGDDSLPYPNQAHAPGAAGSCTALCPAQSTVSYVRWMLTLRRARCGLCGNDDLYRKRAHKHFTCMKDKMKVDHGYAAMENVKTGATEDSCPSYWWAEQMKYYGLIFSSCPRFDYKKGYLTTEGHLLRAAVRPVTRSKAST